MTQLPNGQVAVHGTTKAEAKWAIERAKEMGEGGERRVTGSKNLQVVVMGTDGKQHLLGAKGGFRPDYLKGKLSQPGNMSDVLADLAEDVYGDDAGWEPTGEYELIIM